jgi:hypothetical protein
MFPEYQSSDSIVELCFRQLYNKIIPMLRSKVPDTVEKVRICCTCMLRSSCSTSCNGSSDGKGLSPHSRTKKVGYQHVLMSRRQGMRKDEDVEVVSSTISARD